MKYQVVKRGHKIGHHSLEYGSTVTWQGLGIKKAELQPFIDRGVLRPVGDKIIAPEARAERHDAERASD